MFRIVIGLIGAVCAQLAAPATPAEAVRTVSALRPELAGISGSGESSSPLLSGDGRIVAFTSGAGNLIANDSNDALDVFVFDRQTQVMTLVSSNVSGTSSGNGRSVALNLNTNGQWLLILSWADDLIAGDTNAAAALFLKNLSTGQTLLASVNRDGGASTNGTFNSTGLSEDGRCIVFDSPAADLHAADTNGLLDVFVRDVVGGSNDLVSVRLDGLAGGNGNSEKPVLSEDARWIAFQSTASNLATNDTTTTSDIFRRDRQNGTTTLVSVNRFGTGAGNVASIGPSISADGRYVAFESKANNLTTNVLTTTYSRIYLRDLDAGTTILVSSQSDDGNAYRAVISADGRFVAYESVSNLYCMEVASRTVFKLTTNHWGAGGGSALSHSPQFTPDGQHCVFLSFATNLTGDAVSAGPCRIFLRDMSTGNVSLITANRPGTGSELESLAPAISADGGTVAFQSYDEALVEDDLNGTSDVFLRDATNAAVTLLSRRAAALPSATSISRSGIGTSPVSADGRFVLFSSTSSRLADGNTRSLENLFVRDLWIGSNRMASVSAGGGEGGDGFNFTPALSGDGRWAVFQSTSTNLVAGDSNNAADIFIRDLVLGTNLLVSRAWTGAGANNFSVNPRVSSNGQFVVFQSLASNLTPQDTNALLDVFVRDLAQQTNLALSVNPLTGECVGAQASSGTAYETPYPPLITPDGQWAVLWSLANLTTNASPSGTPGLYARHLPTGEVLALGIPTNGMIQAGNNTATLSPGGKFVVFTTTNGLVGIFDFAARTNTFALAQGRNPSLSADGRWLAFDSPATNWGVTPGNNVSDVFVLDRQSESVRLLSSNRLGNASGNGASTRPLISGDGRFVVFESKADDLVDQDANGRWDVFVRDRQTETTFALLTTTNGATGNHLSRNPALGSDGRTVILESFASDASTNDFNQFRDVFVIRLSAGDSDGDGLADDWEVAHFGNLSRNGSGDADGDGATDAAEFQAGTNPADPVSVLRVITLTSLGGGGTTLLWSSVPGRTYRVEFKDDLATSGWSSLAEVVFATGSTASALDSFPAPSGRRFYRVLLVN